MTLNSSFPGYSGKTRAKNIVEGPERGLDALVGLVILLAGLFIGFVAFEAMFAFASGVAERSYSPELAELGIAVALFGGGGILLIAILVYLVRIVRGRRSWTATLWGTLLMSACLVLGYLLILGAA
jgi:hypothetical protein